jgi:IS30 family transposase
MNESKLNGVNSEDARHTWIVGDRDLEEKIAKLYPTHTYTQIAQELNRCRSTISVKVTRLIRSGRLQAKGKGSNRMIHSQNGVFREKPGEESR